MNTYTELKDKEKEIIEAIRNLRVEKIKLIEELEENAKKYPNQFKALPEREEIDLCDMNRRFDVIEESIRISKLEEETKNSVLELVKSIKERFSQNQEKAKHYDNEKSVNNLKLEEREKYLEEKLSQIEENIKLIKRNDKKISIHKQLIANEEIDNVVKEKAQNVIAKLQEEKETIIKEKEEILKEPNLKEDLKLLKGEELILQETAGNNSLVEENAQEQLAEENLENTPEVIEEQTETRALGVILNERFTENQEEISPELNPVIPEEPQEVIEVHQAPTELKSKIKKFGKIGLGVLIIGAAVAAIIANPLALVAIPAGGLVWDQAKEKMLKK